MAIKKEERKSTVYCQLYGGTIPRCVCTCHALRSRGIENPRACPLSSETRIKWIWLGTHRSF